jgi:DNA-directed RNA polymerase subunit RPC12/RpoP
MAGRRGPCAACGAKIEVPNPPVMNADEDNEPSQTYFRSPKYVAVECRVCQTRLYGTPDQVGQELKCPDCGVRTVLPAPPPAPAKNWPAALDGEQYELWDVDSQPLPSELIAAQPEYIAVECSLCATRLQATIDQVGQAIRCPDCGAQTVVPPPSARKPKPDVLADEEPYAVDESASPGERPPVVSVRRYRMQFEEAEEAARAEARADPKGFSRRRGRLDVRGRPILPRQPLLSGILPFMFSTGVAERWVGLSAGYMCSVYLLMEGMIWGGIGGLASISAMMFFVLGMFITTLLTAAAAGILKDIVTESSEGNEQVQHWNTRYIAEWFPDLLYLVLSVFASAFPGSMTGRLVIPDYRWQIAVAGAGAVVLFPLVYLSQLFINSPFAVLSGRILSTFKQCPGSWLLLYVESFVLWGGCVAAGMAAAILGVHPVIAIPLYVAAFLLYARLLGRLGWRLAEAVPTSD